MAEKGDVENPIGSVEMQQPTMTAVDTVPVLRAAVWRGETCDGLCDCVSDCQCPMYCFVCMLPQVIWAQLFYHINQDRKKYALCGYWTILVGFSILYTLSYGLASSAYQIGGSGGVNANILSVVQCLEMITWLLGFILVLSLYKKIRAAYGIRGNACNRDCCGGAVLGRRPCCGDEYADCCEAWFCLPCATMKLGHHVFDFSSDNGSAITYEPLTQEFDLLGETWQKEQA